MRRFHRVILSVSVGLTLPLFGVASASAQQGPQYHPGHNGYADGTGNSMIDQLNTSQLNGNYKGPYYQRGEAPPPFRPIQLAPPSPPPPPRHPRRMARQPMPDRSMSDRRVPPGVMMAQPR